MTSFDVVAWLRRVTGEKKAGHCGALDPDAAGALPVCIGAATGITGYLTDAGKAYRVEAVPGLLTDTLDTSGVALKRGPAAMPPRAAFEAALASFIGPLEQFPPMYSAIKVNGQRLYKLARKGVETEVAPRKIEIYALKTVLYRNDRVIFDVECAKGTYIRSLCRDIGDALGMYLCMSFLTRTMSAGLRLEDARTLAEIAARARDGTLGEVLIPADAPLGAYHRIDLTCGQYARYMNGATVRLDEGQTAGFNENPVNEGAVVRTYYNGGFLGMGGLTPTERLADAQARSGRAGALARNGRVSLSLKVKKFI